MGAVQIGGISAKELNRMELHMMQQLDYRLVVSLAEINEQLATLKVSLPSTPPHLLQPRHGHKRTSSAQQASAQLPRKALEVSVS